MAADVRYKAEVHLDLDEACAWYDKRRPGLGDDFLNSVVDCIKKIRTAPKSFARIDGELRRALVSRFPYLVFYEYDGQCVIVFAVLHTSRNPQVWRRRLSS